MFNLYSATRSQKAVHIQITNDTALNVNSPANNRVLGYVNGPQVSPPYPQAASGMGKFWTMFHQWSCSEGHLDIYDPGHSQNLGHDIGGLGSTASVGYVS